jgi:hypothetical protein
MNVPKRNAEYVVYSVLTFSWRKAAGHDADHSRWEDQDVAGWIILGWILRRLDGVMWTGLVLLRTGTGGELL